ncbi:MAG: hypothetical protein NC204_05680 [Candidatus Amulumruptor caecigallinarius]|nr:hypothetical protein [Candidatus Amulumruptor caecigallinarius]
MNKKQKYCGECRNFLYEDTSGYGICSLDNELYSCTEQCIYGNATSKKEK